MQVALAKSILHKLFLTAIQLHSLNVKSHPPFDMSTDVTFKRRKLNTSSYRGTSPSSDPTSLRPALARTKLNKGANGATPRSHGQSTPRQHEFDTPEPDVNDQDQLALDRDWYGGEENGHAFGDETHNPFGGMEDSWAE